jgi:hypothetical protein
LGGSVVATRQLLEDLLLPAVMQMRQGENEGWHDDFFSPLHRPPANFRGEAMSFSKVNHCPVLHLFLGLFFNLSFKLTTFDNQTTPLQNESSAIALPSSYKY